MTIPELIQLIRQLNLAQVRAQLEQCSREELTVLQAFYESAWRQPK
jgi:hypothetical protein